jgi:hypothetical protein
MLGYIVQHSIKRFLIMNLTILLIATNQDSFSEANVLFKLITLPMRALA